MELTERQFDVNGNVEINLKGRRVSQREVEIRFIDSPQLTSHWCDMAELFVELEAEVKIGVGALGWFVGCSGWDKGARTCCRR